MLSFEEQSILSWSPIYFLINFFFCGISFCLINKFCLLQGCEDFFLSSRTFIILAVIFSPVVHFESFLYIVWVKAGTISFVFGGGFCFFATGTIYLNNVMSLLGLFHLLIFLTVFLYFYMLFQFPLKVNCLTLFSNPLMKSLLTLKGAIWQSDLYDSLKAFCLGNFSSILPLYLKLRFSIGSIFIFFLAACLLILVVMQFNYLAYNKHSVSK